ncbi:hypothetical protein B0T16DRAFT_449059 [Cercophora newfieldiana]|uniref:Uncharacterized protein n=1 Tax=Cercophora newfieldiana TaxID=92897 RepID=A0AA39XWR1_9PEZI|nr:hypothetical protein B0T16DRAFT_449059 [Cercophora newfieldiana]
MATQFRLFTMLPGELRDMIWDCAIRSAEPGAHFFATIDVRTVQHKHMFAGSMGELSLFRRAAPQGRTPGFQFRVDKADTFNHSWTQNNPSAYLIDGGLWTACRESYLAMRRAFPKGDQDVKSSWFLRDRPRAYQHKPRKVQHFTIRPSQDLVIFQQPPGHSEGFNQTLGIDSWGKAGIRNAGIEYHPNWGPDDTRIFREMVNIMAHDHTGSLATLWFIDYSLDINSLNLAERNRAVFRGATCRFVEVFPGEARGASFRLASALTLSLEGLQESVIRLLWPKPANGVEQKDVEYKVLACDWDATK